MPWQDLSTMIMFAITTEQNDDSTLGGFNEQSPLDRPEA